MTRVHTPEPRDEHGARPASSAGTTLLNTGTAQGLGAAPTRTQAFVNAAWLHDLQAEFYRQQGEYAKAWLETEQRDKFLRKAARREARP